MNGVPICQTVSEMRPPKPAFTEKDLGDLSGKVYIVTGGTSGIGYELLKVLYPTGARLYLAGRSEPNAQGAISTIRAAHPDVKGGGHLEFLYLDLSDLSTIKRSAEEFQSKESRLDVLWLNAGVMMPPKGSTTKQGYELQLGTNVLGHYLFATLLQPLLADTAALKDSAPASVRVIWVSSSAHAMTSFPGGINYDDINFLNGQKAQWDAYGQSKAGDVILAKEFARRYGETGVVSLSLNPGNLRSGLQRHAQSLGMRIMYATLLFDPWYGAMTLLFAGCSPKVDLDNNGKYIIPWGRWGLVRRDVWEADGTRFWNWCEREVAKYR